MENHKTTSGVIDQITEVIKTEIELEKDLTKQQFTITVEYYKNSLIISADTTHIRHLIENDYGLFESEAIITGDIEEALQEIITNR